MITKTIATRTGTTIVETEPGFETKWERADDRGLPSGVASGVGEFVGFFAVAPCAITSNMPMVTKVNHSPR